MIVHSNTASNAISRALPRLRNGLNRINMNAAKEEGAKFVQEVKGMKNQVLAGFGALGVGVGAHDVISDTRPQMVHDTYVSASKNVDWDEPGSVEYLMNAGGALLKQKGASHDRMTDYKHAMEAMKKKAEVTQQYIKQSGRMDGDDWENPQSREALSKMGLALLNAQGFDKNSDVYQDYQADMLGKQRLPLLEEGSLVEGQPLVEQDYRAGLELAQQEYKDAESALYKPKQEHVDVATLQQLRDDLRAANINLIGQKQANAFNASSDFIARGMAEQFGIEGMRAMAARDSRRTRIKDALQNSAYRFVGSDFTDARSYVRKMPSMVGVMLHNGWTKFRSLFSKPEPIGAAAQ